MRSDPVGSAKRPHIESSELAALEQHHALLFRLIERFHSLLAGRYERTDVIRSLTDFLSYMAMHFAAEERVMLAVAYPGFAEHRQEHDEALSSLREIDEDYRGGRDEAAQKALRFIEAWKTAHVFGMDKTLDDWLDHHVSILPKG